MYMYRQQKNQKILQHWDDLEATSYSGLLSIKLAQVFVPTDNAIFSYLDKFQMSTFLRA